MSGRILLIEDNEANIQLITYLLRTSGYTVSCAREASVAWTEVSSSEYDLILVDVIMPGWDGRDFARRLKNDSRHAKIPLVAVTALAMVGDREMILGSGFDECITKPFEPLDFLSCVRRFAPLPTAT